MDTTPPNKLVQVAVKEFADGPEMKITREELYDALWKLPISKLSTTWQVPITNIVRAAEQMNVPRPAGGHWQLVKLGRNAEPESLSAADTNSVLSVDLKSSQRRMKPRPTRAQVLKVQNVTVSTDSKQLHKIVRAMYDMMKDAREIEHGPVKLEEAGTFSVWVSRSQIRRALLILDTIVKEVEKRGGTFVQDHKFTKHLVVKFPAGNLSFQIAERMDHKWTPTKREPLHGGGYFQHHDWRYFPKGTLGFSVLEYYPKGVRKNWNDGKRQKLEDCLSDIVECLEYYPELAKNQQDQWQREVDERNRQRHEDYLRRSAPERLVKMTDDFKKHIAVQSALWNKAGAVRNYLEAFETAILSAGGKRDKNGWERRWLSWGHDWLNSFDPLSADALEQLRSKFEELEKLEAFVAELKEGSPDDHSNAALRPD
jgi:hypothetical protein